MMLQFFLKIIMASSRWVRGYHGTILDYGLEMAQLRFIEREKNVYRWLGSGVYFFEENLEFAQRWALMRGVKAGKAPAVVQADIDVAACLDLTRAPYQSILRSAYWDLTDEWDKNPGTRPEQKPLEIYKGQIRSGYHGEWENYGRNELDFRVIEHAIVIAKAQFDVDFDTVRGAFLELGPLYKNSWLYEGAHVAIAVRKPYVARLRNLKCVEI
jgi:hypothetical protein